MPSPFKGRWTPVPDEAGTALLRAGKRGAYILWIALLSEATSRRSWTVTLSLSDLIERTDLSLNTVRKSLQDLVDGGYAAVTAGGGTTRRRTTYTLTPIESLGCRKPEQPDSKPIGDWTL